MARRTPLAPQTPTVASEAENTTTTTTETEVVAGVSAPEGDPTPPAQGNEGQADTAGEGKPSLATPVPSFVVTGPKKGRRRAGRSFGPEPVTIPAADLTEDEIAALTSDPGLTVTLIDAPY